MPDPTLANALLGAVGALASSAGLWKYLSDRSSERAIRDASKAREASKSAQVEAADTSQVRTEPDPTVGSLRDQNRFLTDSNELLQQQLVDSERRVQAKNRRIDNLEARIQELLVEVGLVRTQLTSMETKLASLSTATAHEREI
jgi:septal ring factor EnvC (AmiA/AmiB activator)